MGVVSPLSLSSRTARLGALTLWLLLAVAWGSALTTGVGAEDIAAGLWSVVAVGISWLILWRPRVKVQATGLTIVNPVREVTISWAAITEVDTTWAMRVKTDNSTVTAWAVIAPGRHAGFWAERDQTAYLPSSTYQEGTVRPGDLVGTESGEIAAIIRRAWEAGSHHFPTRRTVEAHRSGYAKAVAALCGVGAVAALLARVFPVG